MPTSFSEIPFVQGAQGIVSAQQGAAAEKLRQDMFDNTVAHQRATLAETSRHNLVEEDAKAKQTAFENMMKMPEAALKRVEGFAKFEDILGGRSLAYLNAKTPEEKAAALAALAPLKDVAKSIGYPMPENMDDPQWHQGNVANAAGARDVLRIQNQVHTAKRMDGTETTFQKDVFGEGKTELYHGKSAAAAGAPERATKAKLDKYKAYYSFAAKQYGGDFVNGVYVELDAKNQQLAQALAVRIGDGMESGKYKDPNLAAIEERKLIETPSPSSERPDPLGLRK